MLPTLITIVQGNQGFDLNFTLTDAQGVAVNISSASLFFDCQLISDSAVQFKNPMTVISAVAGTCKYTTVANDFAVAGTYAAQIVVQYNSGEIISFDGITVVVNPSLPVT